MSKPSRVPWTVAVTALVFVMVAATLLVLPDPNLRPATSTAGVTCQSPTLTNDYQIGHCLSSAMKRSGEQMSDAVRTESTYLGYVTRAQDLRVAQHTQRTFRSFAREECLQQANPYRTGTIVPILFGECMLGLFQQRLTTLEAEIATLRSREASPGSSS